MTQKAKILHIISLIRESHPEMVKIYTQGSCLNFFCILRAIFPEAKPYFNIDHIVTEIGGSYYDITGLVSGKGYTPYTEFYDKRRTTRSFTQMYNYAAKI